jgi:hypothetical protein
MGHIKQEEVNINWIVVAILGLLLGPIGLFIAIKILMKNEKAWLAYTIWSFVPIISIVVWIDSFLVAKKLQEKGQIDDDEHVIDFVGKLPLFKE